MCRNLDNYLSENHKTNKDFAGEIGVSGPTVSRYRNGERIPEPEIMPRIVAATNGQVTPNDFYGDIIITAKFPVNKNKSSTRGSNK